ncbi:hypothetical protein J0383_04780 [Flavobacterium endoglycinae]|uniref:DUF4893 domain-containing protein n=1 Tax=Flavobacterium endoglycinae TaxID=2816357 RepID=A0ABX7QGD0_9FLAO|nr:hypothetical protein [Flavobacterium endoglycinae]QSW90135.1 hypothetical protein J0383_04780 [Flavobacterium endoglycinae]
MKILNAATVFIIVLFASCNGTKENDLEAREQKLILLEKEFSAKEEDYKNLLRLRDSLELALLTKKESTDSIKRFWPDSLTGSWNSKLVCRESACGTYVIGDQRTEKWIFSNDSIGPIVNVMDNNRLKRTFRAEYKDGKARLYIYLADSTAARNNKTTALLDNFSKKVIKGTQSLSGQDDCLVKFSVELSPSPKK